MTSNFWCVFEFNKAFGIYIVKDMEKNANLSIEDGSKLLKDNPKLSKLRYSLIEEEIGELNEAIEQNDIKEIIDALTDILYVVYGAGVSFGINIDTLFREKLNNDGTIFNESDSNYNIIKNIKDYTYHSIQDSYKNYKEQVLNLCEILKVNRDILKEAIDSLDYEVVLTCLVSLTYYTYDIGCVLNIDLDKSFKIVHDSNMSKLCKTNEEAMSTVSNYLKNDSRYDSPSYRKSDLGDYYVVYNASTNKILKSINYTPANFDTML